MKPVVLDPFETEIDVWPLSVVMLWAMAPFWGSTVRLPFMVTTVCEPLPVLLDELTLTCTSVDESLFAVAPGVSEDSGCDAWLAGPGLAAALSGCSVDALRNVLSFVRTAGAARRYPEPATATVAKAAHCIQRRWANRTDRSTVCLTQLPHLTPDRTTKRSCIHPSFRDLLAY